MCKSLFRKVSARNSSSSYQSPHRRIRFLRRQLRQGTTLVEFAVVFPVFLLFVFALIEYGHTLMVANMINSIAKQAAHEGSFDGISTSHVETFANEKIDAILNADAATLSIKDASTYEQPSSNSEEFDVSRLPDIELSNAESRQLFLIHIEVPYKEVALLPPFWVKNVKLKGSSVMRRE